MFSSSVKFYKSLFYLYFTSISLSIFCVLLFNFDTLDLIITIIQIFPAIFSIIIFITYLNESKVFFHFKELIDNLNQDKEWQEIENFNVLISTDKSFSTIKIIKYNKLFLILSSILISLSLILGLLIAQNFIFLLLTILFLIFLIIIKEITHISNDCVIPIKNWINLSFQSIKEDYHQLLQFKIQGMDNYFTIIEQEIENMNNSVSKFNSLIKKNLLKNNWLEIVLFINYNYKAIKDIIFKIYSSRGMLITLMSILLKIRENQIINLKKSEAIQQKQVELERLNIITKKEEKLSELNNQIQNEITQKLEAFENRKDEIEKSSILVINQYKNDFISTIQSNFETLNDSWNNKTKSFNEKINNVYNSNNQRIEDLNQELKENFSRLKSKITELFFEKLYQELTNEASEKTSFDKFLFVADLFFDDFIKMSDKSQLKYVLENLCQIHESISKN